MKLDQVLVTSATGAATVVLALVLGGRHPWLSAVALGALGGLAAGALASYLGHGTRATSQAEGHTARRGLMDYPGARELDLTGGAM